MKRTLFSVLAIVALLSGLLATALPASAAPPLPNYEPIDVGPRIRSWPATPDRIAPSEKRSSGKANSTAASLSVVGDQKRFLVLNDVTGTYGFANFTLAAQGSRAEVWIQNNLSFPADDPRNPVVITLDEVQYLLAQFEDVILPRETSFFRAADFHDGSQSLLVQWGYFPEGYYEDSEGRQIILIENVRDANYFDPTYPVYIAGFFTTAFEAYFDRNVITIDSYDWANRVGPNTSPWRGPDSTLWREFVYDSTFAHEYQHLLHADVDPAEDTWVNEGLAMYAEPLCGYGVPMRYAAAVAARPENSLVAWGDQGDLEILTDYGLAYLYQGYMYEKFGQQFIQAEFQDSARQGIASVDGVLADLGTGATFAGTYHDLSVAMYVKGSFTEPALADFQVDVGEAGMRNPEAYATTGAPPWGTDYYLIWGYEQVANFRFNGYAFNPLSWTSDGSVLWSGSGDLIDNWAIFQTTGGGTLSFDTKHNIELGWDFAFVQVSTDGGHTWTSLANEYTTSDHDPSAHPTVLANLPGLTGSQDWVNMSYDLSPYVGQDILVAFRYVTDWASAGNPDDPSTPGWFVDNVAVDGTVISDGSSTAGFKSLNEVLGITNNYTVQFIGERNRAGLPEYEVQTLMSGGHVSAWASIRKMFDNYTQLVMLVTYDASQGVSSYADYTFEIDHRGGIHIKE